MLNYIVPILTACVAFLQLRKNWKAHEVWWRRVLVAVLIMALAVFGMITGYWTTKKSNDQARIITSLMTAVQTANTNQVENTKVFAIALEHLSTKLTQLATEVKTADLQEETKQSARDVCELFDDKRRCLQVG